jgi:hypothetical protein
MSQAGGNSSSGGSGGRSTTVTVSAFQPNVALQEFDDFMNTFGDNSHFSKLTWISPTSSFLDGVPGTNTNPGILVMNNGGSSNNLSMFLKQETASTSFTGAFASGGGAITNSWIVELTSLSSGGNTYRFSSGMADGVTINGGTDAFVDGIYFQYTNTVNGGQWTINCTKASTTTTVNTAVAANTTFNTLSYVINAGGTSVSFYINNALVGTPITTNIPTNPITPFLFSTNLSGNTPNVNADLWYVNVALATPRPGPTFSQVVVGSGQLIEQYTQTATSYQVLNTDAIIGVSSTAAPRTITMPNTGLITGQRWTVKDESGGAQTNNITISGNGKNIDGSATYVINTNYGSVDIYYNGTQFFII